ncbi:hypothetical protein BS50DRAFT_664977, partial [Corynespora cassiicola Philippines]
LPQHNPPITAASQSPQASATPQSTLHLTLCAHKGKHGKSLIQDQIERADTDRKLFMFLKGQFIRYRGKIGSVISLRAVQGIYFFRLTLGDNVEIRTHEPYCFRRGCECLPPKAKVEPPDQAEYRCQPGPPLTYPSVLPSYLMHMFNSPSCINEDET